MYPGPPQTGGVWGVLIQRGKGVKKGDSKIWRKRGLWYPLRHLPEAKARGERFHERAVGTYKGAKSTSWTATSQHLKSRGSNLPLWGSGGLNLEEYLIYLRKRKRLVPSCRKAARRLVIMTDSKLSGERGFHVKHRTSKIDWELTPHVGRKQVKGTISC